MRKILSLLFALLFFTVTHSQNVGIGTTTPEGVLHLKGTNWIKTIFENNTGEARSYIGADNNGTLTIGSNAYWNGSSWVYPFSGSSLYMLLHKLNNRFEFRVRKDGGSQVTAMTIDTGSNVVIGGSLVIDQEDGNTGAVGNSLRFGSNSGEAIGSKRNSGTGQYGLDFYTNSINRMTIANNGNVGIGTNTPQSKLDVNGDLNIENKLLLNNSAGNNRQVLVSNGSSAAPTWQNIAYSNNDRFYYKTDTGISSTIATGLAHKFIQVYAYSTAITQSSPNIFQVNKSGFYKIKYDVTPAVQKSAESSGLTAIGYFHITFPAMPTYSENFFQSSLTYHGLFPAGHVYAATISKEWEIYMPSGTSFQFVITMLATNATKFLLSNNTGLSIHLISE
ncbi:MAG: hypothetical protein U0V75_00915 [Ferruginibacter sp.]